MRETWLHHLNECFRLIDETIVCLTLRTLSKRYFFTEMMSFSNKYNFFLE